MFLGYSTVVAMVVQPASQRIDRIDLYYAYGHGQQSPAETDESSQVEVKTLGEGGALPVKNKVKGPSDLGVYYINSAGRT